MGGLPQHQASAAATRCPSAIPIYLEKEGPFDVPQSILGKPLLHDTDRLDWQNWMRHAGLKHAGAAPGPIFQDFNLLRASALAGQGIALCPRSLIADDLESGRLVQLFDTAIKLDYAYCIIEAAHGSGRRSDAIDLFKIWLLGCREDLSRHSPPQLASPLNVA